MVITEKMDGENTSIYRDFIHARSIDSKYHPSRTWVTGLQAGIGYLLEEDERICGENLYAKHSIAYTDLPSYFLAFSLWHDTWCLDWDYTEDRFKELGLVSVPVLYRGEFPEDLDKELGSWSQKFREGKSEGYVIRTADGFDYSDFSKSVAKFVRRGHVQTDKHWMTSEIVSNKLMEKMQHGCN